MREVHKACACVISDGHLLVFKHPLSGIQLPKGTIEQGEAPEEAVLRELEEESGITSGIVVSKIKESIYIFEGYEVNSGEDQKQIWHLFHIASEYKPPKTWVHKATGSEAEEGLLFSYFWHHLDDQAGQIKGVYADVVTSIRHHLIKP